MRNRLHVVNIPCATLFSLFYLLQKLAKGKNVKVDQTKDELGPGSCGLHGMWKGEPRRPGSSLFSSRGFIYRRGRPQQSWKNQVTDFISSRNMEKYVAQDKHLWR